MPEKKEYLQITKVLNDRLGALSEAELSEGVFQDALQYIIDTCTGTLPPPSTVNLLIFQLLMRNREYIKLDEVGVFLQNLLQTIPSKDSGFLYDYKMAVLDQGGVFPDLWSVLVHLVESSFSHYGIHHHQSSYQPQLVKHPTCDFLIHFYIEYILKFLSLEKDLFIYLTRQRDLIQWIHTLYKFNLEQVEILKDLHNLLDQAVNCKVMLNTSSSVSVALNQTSVFDAASEIFNICKDVLTSYDKFVYFLSYSKLAYLSANICYLTLCEITKKKSLHKSIPLTLKELIRCFFFISLSSQKKRRKTPVFFVKKQITHLNKRHCKDRARKEHLESSLIGDTKLHEVCRKNRMGDLLQMLFNRKRINVNKPNYAGQTPLHIACIFSNYQCAKFLLNSTIGDRLKPIDVVAVDKQDCNSLHYAVIADDKDIVKMLLRHGGEELLHKTDTYGLKPHEYAVSQNMTDTLKTFYPNISLEDDEYDAEEFEISMLFSYDDYPLYLYALYSLLCYYFDIFRLCSIRDKNVSVEDHDKLACSHFSTSSVNVVCIEDYSVLRSLSKYMEELIERVEGDAKSTNIDIKKEVLLLKLISQTLVK